MENPREILIAALNECSEKTGICVLSAPLKHSSSSDVVNATTVDIPGFRQRNSSSPGYVAGLIGLLPFRPSVSIGEF